MIKNQWYAIMESKEVKQKPVGVTRLDEKLVLWRKKNNQLQCIYDQCCHRGASLSLGCVTEDEITCPFHGFAYDGTGKVTLIPANGKAADIPKRFKVHAYLVKEAYGFVWLWYGDQHDGEAAEIPFFEDLKDGFSYKTTSEVWAVHYTRAIENQLDVVHLPFVHDTTIGKGGRTLVNGPLVKWQDTLMSIYVHNVLDDGNKVALKAADLEDYKDLFQLKFQMPNIWQNYIADKVRVFAAFAPIDEHHTKIYLRFYQKFLPLPVLGTFIAGLSNVYNRIILHQDRKVVLTQRPDQSIFKMRENLIAGDLPIIEFRKRREALIEEALNLEANNS